MESLGVGPGATAIVARYIQAAGQAAAAAGGASTVAARRTMPGCAGFASGGSLPNPCLMAAIRTGWVRAGGLDDLLLEASCLTCSRPMAVTVRDVLYQAPFTCSEKEEDDDNYATVRCHYCRRGFYVTRLCHGTPQLVRGMHHHHCILCPGYGACIGDYRQVHCMTCGHHYFAGISAASCPHCFDGSDEDIMSGFW